MRVHRLWKEICQTFSSQACYRNGKIESLPHQEVISHWSLVQYGFLHEARVLFQLIKFCYRKKSCVDILIKSCFSDWQFCQGAGKTDNLYRESLVICCTWRIGLKYGNVLKYEKLKNTPDLSLGNLMAANLKMGHPNPGMRLFTIAFKVAVCFYCIMVVEYIFLWPKTQRKNWQVRENKEMYLYHCGRLCSCFALCK